ncbi:MAG: DUF2062 domain-containing protein [Nitrospirota bacterium]
MKRWLGRQGVRLRRLVKRGETPAQTARAFAIGVFIAFTPTLGLHFISAALMAWLFRLNLPALFAGAAVNNPFTIAPIYGFCLWVGLLFVGGDTPRDPIAWDFSWSVLAQLKPLLAQFVFGTLLVGAVASIISYGLFLRLAQRRLMLRQARAGRKRLRAAAESAGSQGQR